MYFTTNRLVPKEYKYYCLNTQSLWQRINFSNLVPYDSQKTEGFILDKLEPSICQIIKIEINKTHSDDSPQISEIEVIDNKFANIDFEKADKIKEDPFSFVKSEPDLDELNNYLAEFGIGLKICFETNKSSNTICKQISIEPNSQRVYQMVVEPFGTLIKKIKIQKPENIRIEIKSISFEPLTFAELEKIGYIKEYSEN